MKKRAFSFFDERGLTGERRHARATPSVRSSSRSRASMDSSSSFSRARCAARASAYQPQRYVAA